MKKALKISFGVIISALLFYLFIKDVNEVPIIQNSNQMINQEFDSKFAIIVGDASGLELGDSIRISSEKFPEGEEIQIAKIIEEPTPSHRYVLITKKAIHHEYLVEDQAVIHFPRLQRALLSANYFWLLPAFFLTMFALWIRAFRWKYFFSDYQSLRINSLWSAVMIGYMANNILPFRMGELVRAWIFSRNEKRNISESFATIVMERVFDIISILMLFVGFIFYFSSKGDVVLPMWLKEGAWVLAAISFIALMFLLALRFKTDFALHFVSMMIKPLPEKLAKPIMKLIESFILGLNVLSSVYSAVMAFLLSMVIWLILACCYYFIFLSVGIKATLLISMFLIVGLAFAVSIPSAPGFIGTYHFVGKEILKIVGMKGNVEAYVLLAHAMAYIPVVIVGLIYLSLENISFHEMKSSIQKYIDSGIK